MATTTKKIPNNAIHSEQGVALRILTVLIHSMYILYVCVCTQSGVLSWPRGFCLHGDIRVLIVFVWVFSMFASFLQPPKKGTRWMGDSKLCNCV